MTPATRKALLVPVAALATLYLWLPCALFLGLQVGPPHGNIGIAAPVGPTAL